MATRPLKQTLREVEKEWAIDHGRCFMCSTRDKPHKGKHYHGEKSFDCGNYGGCFFCHNAGMEVGDQCACCQRILMEPEF